MSSLFDRMRDELDQLGDRLKDAVESSRLHLERSGLIGQRSKVAYKLGMLTYRRERGSQVDQGEIDALFARMDDLVARIAAIDRQLDDLDGESVRVDEQPAPAAETGEAEVSGGPSS